MSSTDSDQDEIPDEQTCFRLCNEFADLTQTDSACGHFFLQNCGWNLPIAVSCFMDKTRGRSAEDLAPADSTKQFTLLSWNVDGLDPHNLRSRASAVADTILSIMPTAVFLQEVVEENLLLLREKLSSEYDEVPRETSCNYFTKTFLHRDSANCVWEQVIPFEGSRMGRDMMTAQVTIFGETHCCLINAHLESGRQYSKIRKEQLSTAFSLMNAADSDLTVFFGGDLNLRDHEVGTLPEGVLDLWEANGSPAAEKYTWDSVKNDNIGSKGGVSRTYRPRCRFDRIYMKHSSPQHMSPAEFNSYRLVQTD